VWDFYKAKSIKNAVINEKRAIASVKANPKMAILNKSSLIDGFLETLDSNALNTFPIPTPAPARPIVDIPAPINLALSDGICVNCCVCIWFLLIFICLNNIFASVYTFFVIYTYTSIITMRFCFYIVFYVKFFIVDYIVLQKNINHIFFKLFLSKN